MKINTNATPSCHGNAPSQLQHIKKWLQEHLPIATKATHIATQLIHGNLVTYCHHFTERLQYDQPIGPKLVASQFCLVALGKKNLVVGGRGCLLECSIGL
jgi:hypothetical protein